MKQTIKLLIGLQDCDSRIGKITQKRAEGPALIQRLANGVRTAEAHRQATRELFDNAKKERRQHEQRIEDLRGKIQKSNLKLSSIKSNKEYSAVLKEIDDVKREMALEEDTLLEIMETFEGLEKKYAACEAKLKEAQQQYERDQAQILRENNELEKELEAIEKERQTFLTSIDPELLQRYNNLMQHRGGRALSPVVKSVCQACRIHIPPQKFNELIRGEALMSCPNCHRIIYWGEDERFQEPLQDS